MITTNYDGRWRDLDTLKGKPGDSVVFRYQTTMPNSADPNKIHYHAAIGSWVPGEYDHPLDHWVFEERFIDGQACDAWAPIPRLYGELVSSGILPPSAKPHSHYKWWRVDIAICMAVLFFTFMAVWGA